MSEAAPIWRDPLLAAAQSDKPRVSVRTKHLRSLLAEEQRLDAKADHLLSDLRRHEMLVSDRDELIAVLRDERAAAVYAAERTVLASVGLQRELAHSRSEVDALSKALAATTAPSIYASLLKLGVLASLCMAAGFTLHMAWFPQVH